MKLREFEGKKIFSEHGIQVPRSYLVENIGDLLKIDFKECVIKAQVLSGKRKKSGLIKMVDAASLKNEAGSMFGKDVGGETVSYLLVEEKVKIDREMYLSLALDTFEKRIVCIFSSEGGIDIEELAKASPEKIIRFFVDDENSIRKGLKYYKKVSDVALVLYKIMKAMDADLVEINPLVESSGKLMALDSKMIVDDNALFRHKEFMEKRKGQMNDFERKAWECDLHFVDLEGDVGIVGVGAGLVMATMDLIKLNGMEPAFFLDAGGGTSVERMKCAMEIIDKRKPKKVFFNIFGGITRCDEIAQAITDYKNEHDLKIPMVIRIIGTNEPQAKEILKKNGIGFVESVEDAVKILNAI